MPVDSEGVRGTRLTWWHGPGWENLSVLLLVLFLSGCGAGSQPGGGSSGGPVILSQPAIVFSSFRALDGSDAANAGENIWVVSADGTVATPLTKLTTSEFSNSAVWSPDGAKIAFASNRSQFSGSSNPDSGSDIWVMKVDGSGVTALTGVGTLPAGGTGNPMWSPDGLKLAISYECCGLSPFSSVAMLSADGSTLTVLAAACSFSGIAIFDGPSDGVWSPDGSRLVFESPCALDGSMALNANLTANVWLMNADGSGQTALTKVTAKNADCSGALWSPDGSKVVFVSARALDGSDAADVNDTSNIWVMNADGTGAMPLTKLTAAGASSSVPVWSPDGSKLAFESTGALNGTDAANANLTSNIWVVNADGTGAIPLTKLTGAGVSSGFPAWSPGGSKLAFASTRALDGRDLANTADNIWVMNADGSGATPLTKNAAKGADSSNPMWRP